MKTKKTSIIAPSNIAFTKYWGKSNDELTLPNNDSISMCLDNVYTHTTVSFAKKYQSDSVEVTFYNQEKKVLHGKQLHRVMQQVDRIRKIAKTNLPVKIVSKNNFPQGTGIASSASSFAALTHALVSNLDLQISQKELTVLTRLAGSGSATRSIPDGFVRWYQSKDSDTSYAKSIENPKHWQLSDVVVVVSSEEKKYSSLDGHQLASTSPFYKARLETLPKRNQVVHDAIKNKNFTILGEELEKEALSLHVASMTSEPSIWYWSPATIAVFDEVKKIREQGIQAYFTTDAGPNVHIICEQENRTLINKHFSQLSYVETIFESNVGNGSREVEEHLF